MSDPGDLQNLYREVIVDHSRKPRNCRPVEGASATAQGHNPLCGDRVSVQLKMDRDVIADVAFQGAGCAISTASASLMTETLKGRTRDEAERLFQSFHNLLTGKEAAGDLGKLAVFGGVREFPVRVKCATLAWHTLRAALEQPGEKVSTE
jgi:nitrogen fixation NifU-like protein